LKEFYPSEEDFFQMIRDEILLTAEEANNLESHDIWKSFQHKFSTVGELGKYVPFFKYLLKEALLAMIKQNIFIVEYRHISGTLFDFDKTEVKFIDELNIFREVVDDLQL
jgi:hypothetical protein